MTMCSPCADTALPVPGLPIRESTDQRLFNTSPWLIAVVHALHRLLVPRHPPCALDILTVIDPLEPKLVGIDETQFLNWPAVQFSRSGRGADRAPPGRNALGGVASRGDRGRSLKTQQCSCAGAIRVDTPKGVPLDGGHRIVVARPGPVDIPRTSHARTRGGT
jgi:hypothetical protein